ncbi:hypothetical protein BDV95DRAFT_604594 [Massariosphaeria phaeospora]|uniref:Flo11 n=1 Tax=Massariosphaeria phaeospora TaxID=100035 RepID=A0A7C8IDL6_9PLEO|nr:hypothetical protein BDV95DRAFT_604594 [Massariosphaeria phaeospora]
MHRHTRSEAGDRSSPRSSRAASFSSDRPSLAGSVTFQMPSTVRPAPAYIAASVASQIVTDHYNAQLRDVYGPDNDNDDDDDGAALYANALFSEQALYLLNGFLDHLLFAYLSTARSPSLTAIRPAITEVLKPRLAREATATADEELQGLLAGDDEEFPAQEGKDTGRWDVEKVWKRTRLRIMVYTRLGELEDEDEERYVQQERGLSMDDSDDDEAGLVSWASAIFLTSVIEYVAEQTLLVSGQAAFTRVATRMKKLIEQPDDGEDRQLERIVVDDFDVEKIALNSALGRLWRTWRKRARASITPLSPARGPRYVSSFTSLHRRRISHDTMDGSVLNSPLEVPEHKPTETEIAANIPLPMGDKDVDEIEVPGLARTFEDAESSGTETPVPRQQRPTSVIMPAPVDNFRTRISKDRPLSMPSPDAAPFVVPTEFFADEHELETPMETFETPMERFSDDDSYIMDERQEGMSHTEEEDEVEDDADMVAFAASTGMGFGMTSISPVQTRDLDKGDDDTAATPTQAAYDGETQVLRSKRMSIERTGPPGIVRTYSSRSTSLHERTPSATPDATPTLEQKPYLNYAPSDEDLNWPGAIGVAHTSNVPIRTPSPTGLAINDNREGQGYHPAPGGFVEVLPRHTATSSMAVRTPSPEERPAPPESSVPRKEALRKEAGRKDASPTRTKPRGPPLESLQETESWSDNVQPNRHGSPSSSSLKQSPSLRSREAPVAVSERSLKSRSIDGSPRSRAAADGATSTLKRISSSSSTARSVSTSILHTSTSARNSDTSLAGRPRGISGRMSEEDRAREFDTLVKGQETVKFTLTPQNMRDIEEPPTVKRVEQPQPTKSVKPVTSSVTVYPRVDANRDSSFGSQHLPVRSSSRAQAPVPPSVRPAQKPKIIGGKALAREPRVQSESMRDFADFIRSTGPAAGEPRPVQPFVALAGPPNPANSSSSSISGLGRKLSTKQAPSHSHSNSSVADGPSAKPRVQMEPRSPAGQRSGNDDLIDFIRQGPPGANNGQPRIPRSVAPFRSTVDSDQFERMLDDNGNIESAYGSQVSTVSKQSTHTVNSRTGLLPSPNVQPAYSNTPQKLTGSLSNPEPHIQRTRRRVKDPYAIDLSDDEDDDLLTALPKSGPGKPRQEESLMDFLSGMEPPPASEPQPLLLNGAAIAAARARAQNSANPPAAGAPPPGHSMRNGASPRSSPYAPHTHSASSSSATATSTAPKAYKPRFQARGDIGNDTRAQRSATNDLADFLRTSGPPEPMVSPAATTPPGSEHRKNEGRRLDVRFWRRKTADVS